MPYGKPSLFSGLPIENEYAGLEEKKEAERVSFDELALKINERVAQLKAELEKSGMSKEALLAALAQLEQAGDKVLKFFDTANALTLGGIAVGLASICLSNISEFAHILLIIGPIAGIAITGAGLYKSQNDKKTE